MCCAAVSASGIVLSILTVVKVAIVFGIALAAFLLAKGNLAHFSMTNAGGACEGVSAAARGGIGGFAAAMLGALWGYDGWSNLSIVAGEVKNPRRNIPLALIGGMMIVITLYVAANVAYFYVLSPTAIANVSTQSSVATEVVETFLGHVAAGAMAMALLISSLGSLMSSILVGARIPYAMSRDALFFEGMGKVSQRTRVPVNALIVQAVWISLLTLSGSFDSLTDSVIFASWIFYALNTASVFIFRKRRPDMDRPYRTWGYPVTPIIFLLIALWLFVSTILTAPLRSLIGIGLMALGFPLYWYWGIRKAPAAVRTSAN
jgi:APA family basic amino acid/polyamine antiporter